MSTEELLTTLTNWLSAGKGIPDTQFAAVVRQTFAAASKEQAYEAISPFILEHQGGNDDLTQAALTIMLALTEPAAARLERDPRWFELGLQLYEDRPRFILRPYVSGLLRGEHPERQTLVEQALERLFGARNTLLERIATPHPLLEGVSEEICSRYSLGIYLSRPPDATLSAMKLNRKGIDEILEALGDRAKEVTGLSFSLRRLNKQAMEAIAGHPTLSHFKRLEFRNSQIKNVGLKELLKSPHLGQLEHLDVSNCGLTKPAIAALGKAETLPALKSLVLGCEKGSGDKSGFQEQDALIKSKTLHLERLALRGWEPIRSREAFATCELVRGLKELDLSGMEMRYARADVDLMGHLARAGSPIEAIDLSKCYAHSGDGPTDWNSVTVGDDTVQTEPMPKLTRLAMDDCGFDAKMLAVLCKAHFFPRLKELSLQRSKLGAGDLGPLLESIDLDLEALDLSGSNSFRIEALEELAQWPRASALERLTLKETDLRAKDIERVPQLKAAMLAGGWPDSF
jgi:hypothetical protein